MGQTCRQEGEREERKEKGGDLQTSGLLGEGKGEYPQGGTPPATRRPDETALKEVARRERKKCGKTAVPGVQKTPVKQGSLGPLVCESRRGTGFTPPKEQKKHAQKRRRRKAKGTAEGKEKRLRRGRKTNSDIKKTGL